MALARRLSRGGLYYGWYIVTVSFLAQFVTSGQMVSAPSILLKPMVQDLEWSRAMFSGVISISMVFTGLLTPLAGPLVDRGRGRALLLAGAVITGGGVMALGLVQEAWHFYLLRGLVIALGLLAMGPVVTNVAVSNWFIRKRGRALAIAAMGLSAGGVAWAPLTNSLYQHLDWRYTWLVLGLITWALVLPPSALFMRRRPEDLGLRPDGESPEDPATAAARAAPAEISWTPREAIRTRALWLLTAAFALGMMAQLGLLFHAFPYLTDLKIQAGLASLLISAQAFASLSGKLVWGFMVERVPVRYCAAFCFSVTGAMSFLLVTVTPLGAIYAWIILMGLGWSGIAPVQEVAWANYFGRLSLGAVRSIGFLVSSLAIAGGPYLAGQLYDVTGSYTWALGTFAALLWVSAILVLLAFPPRKRALAGG